MPNYSIYGDNVKEVDPRFEFRQPGTGTGGKNKNTIYWIIALASVAVLLFKKK